jgi:putative transposase
MSDYRRWYVSGGTCFFTVVTCGRRPILCSDPARHSLHAAIDRVREAWPFQVVAIALLPDHLHTVWTLPSGDTAYSVRWKLIKAEFTRKYLKAGGHEISPNPSRLGHCERGVWQRRYWEHTVRDEADLKRCVDYIHWNPKKHGHVVNVCDWPWSSFHRSVRLGEYTTDWGAKDPMQDSSETEWGE